MLIRRRLDAVRRVGIAIDISELGEGRKKGRKEDRQAGRQAGRQEGR